jgi:hypothetical protein
MAEHNTDSYHTSFPNLIHHYFLTMNEYKILALYIRVSAYVFRFPQGDFQKLVFCRLMKRVCFDVSEESAASHFTPIEFGSGGC